MKNKKQIIAKVVISITAVCVAVIIAPNIKSKADGTTVATAFHAIVRHAGDDASVVDTDVTYSVKSKGIVNVDYENDGTNEIVIDSSDFKKLAYLENNLNLRLETGFNNAIKYRNNSKTAYDKLGMGINISTVKASGFDKAVQTKELAETVLNKIGY